MLDVKSLDRTQRLTLRCAVVSLIYYGLALVEGSMLRVEEADWSWLPPEHFFAVMTVHPILGIFGGSFILVFGAFYYLVPLLLKRPLYSFKLAEASWIFMFFGVGSVWLSGFLFRYGALYTNYWPLPGDAEQFSGIALASFGFGLALIAFGAICFSYNIFRSVFHDLDHSRPLRAYVGSAFGADGFANLFRRLRGKKVKEPIYPVAIVAFTRGTVDTLLNAIVFLLVAVMFTIYGLFAMFGSVLSTGWLHSLAYKNVYWFGLDLIADGLVLIYVAGAWYLLAQLITGKPIFMENVARALLLLEMVVSWFVFGHHLLADQGQPIIMRIVSGELMTISEMITMGTAIAITLITLWKARPLKMTLPLMFLIGSIFGFAMGVPAGIIQADLGANTLLHNSQWVIGPHAHMMLLVGLGMTLFAVLYFILPLVTNNMPIKYPWMGKLHFWLLLIGGAGMAVSMGYAGMNGMLRRQMYAGETEFQPYMIAASFFGALIVLSWVILMWNLVSSIGIKGLIQIFTSLWSKKLKAPDEPVTASA